MNTATAIRIAGNLLASDLTTELASGDIKGQSNVHFGLEKSTKLEDEIAFAWGEAKDQWRIFQRRLERVGKQGTGTSETREYWAVPLLKLLGYEPILQDKAEVIDNQTFAISHRAEKIASSEDINPSPPLHVIGCKLSLEERSPSGRPRLSAHGLLQEYLNRTEHLWGIVTNGLQWRLLRDCSLMTRLTFVEFDLEQIFNNENFAEFGLFYRLFHRTRLPENIDDVDSCLLEFYHQEALQQGGRVRDRLRDGVEEALKLLGSGFLQHPQNEGLREAVMRGELSEQDYYRQLLLMIYRLLFLMVAESRNLLLDGEDIDKARIYTEYYSINRLRALAERKSYRREGFQDIWQGLRVTFSLFDESWRGQLLGLSPLNGDLFGSKSLETLDSYAIDNHDLLLAIRHLSLYENRGQLRRVNYAALDVEELGSVYESLLDFTPKIVTYEGIYAFKLVTGSDRKTTGSYYTPPELVGQLIKSALEPVIAERLQGKETIAEKEEALLSLTVCDPACGSGHFLLAAARRIGKELARIRTGEVHPSPEPLSQAVRDVIQHCIYGVDYNPLSVDLCKVALWIEGFCKGYPLNFLDHRIKCGNSLVGVLDISVLKEGIPDGAFKAVTGDERKWATALKKRNKQEIKNLNNHQLSLFDSLEIALEKYAQDWQELGKISENNTDDVKLKKERYLSRHSEENEGWWRDYSACNLWTAAFFMPLTENNLQLLPTTEALHRLLEGNKTTTSVVKAANQLAQEKRFFHWCLEFPEVFDNRGFSCVLGNPPWERIKLQEKEFFASKDEAIATAKNKAARTKLIKQLAQTNPKLLQEFEEAKHDADAQGKFIRESARFLLTSKGDINTYAVFAETVRTLINAKGRVGVVVPSGIASNDTTKDFFADLIVKQSLVSLFGFTNWAFIFPDVGDRFAFCLLTLIGDKVKQTSATFTYHCHQISDLNQSERYFNLSEDDIKLINPNTLTCPIFRSNPDAEITKKIYQRVPVLENEATKSNPWGISFMRMFDMSNDSHLFKNETGEELLPLYEAKMFSLYNHRYGTYMQEMLDSDQVNFKGIPTPTIKELQDPNFTVNPRHWVDKFEVENKLNTRWNKKYLLGFRSITNVVNERTVIFSILPISACSNMSPLLLPEKDSKLIAIFMANLNSLVFDFIARQKLGTNALNFFIVKQLPIIPPDWYTEEDIEFISSRVLELTYTAYDMKPFAEDMGYSGEPFIWDEDRRAILRAELDAKFAKLYGLTRDELRYILDPADVYGEDFPSETFRVLKNNEMKKYGEYRTQRLVLAAWDMMGY
ncbi:MAG: N-6 DNA methylase [Crocosphaera sp.]|nr:N-6 DNA methylase [Crocosphaera sp.]